jgi:DNA-binding transcriptional ArsR family regulator/uncharacterized protein YndB with AHSA1/START domain
MIEVRTPTTDQETALWRALANTTRRDLMDALRDGPRTTGDLAHAVPELSRFAVMQHLAVLVEAGLVLVRREGRLRFNYLNAVPLQLAYERWVTHLAGDAAAEATRMSRAATNYYKETHVSEDRDEFRVVRIENELRFSAPAERVFDVLTRRTREWFPASYGGERTVGVVMEERVNGAVYEDWGDGRGHLYGHITVWDPPHAAAMRTRLHPGSTMDTAYTLRQDGDDTVLAMSRVVVGPITAEQAVGIHTHGDLAKFEGALRALIEPDAGAAAPTHAPANPPTATPQ